MARAKEFEDEVGDLMEHVAFMWDDEERAATRAKELAAKAAVVEEELKATKRALERQQAMRQALQEQVRAGGHAGTSGVVEDL